MKLKKENQMPITIFTNQESTEKLTKLVLSELQIKDKVFIL